MGKTAESRSQIIEGCREAHALAEWAREAGLDATGQQFAPILFAGIYTQDTRLLRSLGGFPLELARTVRTRARRAKIWHGAGVIGSDWLDEEYGEITFLLDLMVICGAIRRVNRRGRETSYALPRRGKARQ